MACMWSVLVFCTTVSFFKYFSAISSLTYYCSLKMSKNNCGIVGRNTAEARRKRSIIFSRFRPISKSWVPIGHTHTPSLVTESSISMSSILSSYTVHTKSEPAIGLACSFQFHDWWVLGRRQIWLVGISEPPFYPASKPCLTGWHSNTFLRTVLCSTTFEYPRLSSWRC